MFKEENTYTELILASEDFSEEEFIKYHCFTKYEQNIIDQLMAHGPVLLKGGRGTGKSALLREASNRMRKDNNDYVCGIYLSLRHLPLLRTKGAQYEREFFVILVDKIKKIATNQYGYDFICEYDTYSVHQAIIEFSERIQKRIVFLFDDAAHIGREAGLEEFFDIFRTLSSGRVSCKAAIYPGVTKFGIRFDVYNDAKILDISRRYGQTGFNDFFKQVLELRMGNRMSSLCTTTFSVEQIAEFLGMAVLGNVRSFIKGCSILIDEGQKITYINMSEVFLTLSSDFFWPMMEEVKYKLGMYEPMVDCCIEIAELIYSECGSKQTTTCIIHRNLVNKYSKPLEILEYVGFIVKKEASRGMKSGGRGTRYAINLCNELENVSGTRITKDLYLKWINSSEEDVQFSASSVVFNNIELPEVDIENSVGILDLDIQKLEKSNAFPYGLTLDKITRLKEEEICTVGKLAECSKDRLKQIYMIGDVMAERIRNTVEQAIWM
jgi:hypothetical protein